MGQIVMERAAAHQGEVKGTLDLAKLSQVLPATLRVREGMQIEEGAVNVDLTSGLENGNWACSGRVETTRLLATEQGRQIAWDHPLAVTVAGHDTPQGPVIEQLNGESDFLKFEGSGTPDFFGLTANFELARLAEELGQFVDLGELRIAGDGWSRLTWKRGRRFVRGGRRIAGDEFRARPAGQAGLERCQAGGHGGGQGAARRQGHLARVETASVQVASATDEFTAMLVSPVEHVRPQAKWPIEAHLRGELARWMARIEPWTLPARLGHLRPGRRGVTVHYSTEAIEIGKVPGRFLDIARLGTGAFHRRTQAALNR